MAKVRFSCPRCHAVMQTNEEKIGYDIACPQCSHRFTLVEPDSPSPQTIVRPPSSPPAEETRQWVEKTVEKSSPVVSPPLSQSALPIGGTIPPIYQGQATNSFCCPFCQTRQPPIWKSEISTAGWITAVVLLCTTVCFFWIGFLIRDKYSVCSVCNVRLPRQYQ